MKDTAKKDSVRSEMSGLSMPLYYGLLQKAGRMWKGVPQIKLLTVVRCNTGKYNVYELPEIKVSRLLWPI